MPTSKSPPEVVPIVKIVPVGHFIFPECEIAMELTEEERREEYYRQIRECGHAIFAPQFIYDQEKRSKTFPFGTLAKVVAEKRCAPDLRIKFEGLMRVRYELARGKIEQGMAMGRWTQIIDEPVAPEIFQLPDLHLALEHLKQVFGELMARVVNKGIFKQKFVRRTMTAVENLGENVNQGALTSLLYGVMNMVPYIGFEGEKPMDLLKPSFMIFRQTDLLERLASITMLLDILAHPPTIVGAETETRSVGENTSSRPRGKASPPISKEELIKILFHDELALPQETEGEPEEELVISESDEPPSIAQMREFVSGRVIGQGRPIRAIGRALNLAKAGNFPREGPLLKAVFAGPKGVGKTELAKDLADWLWEAEKRALARAKEQNTTAPFTEAEIAKPPLVKVPCGDFSGENSHGVSNLIGSPVGYTGSKGTSNAQPPTLRPELFPPNRIVVALFDELERAFLGARSEGAELMGIMMEFMNTGRYKNRWGEEVDFSRTIVICTSNVGSVKIMQSAKEPAIGIRPRRNGNGKKKKRLTEEEIERLNEKIYETTRDEYVKMFLPQFRDRLGRLIVFRFLTDSEYQQIVQKVFREEVLDWAERVAGIKVELDQEAAQWILEELKFEEGVRDVREFIRKEVSEPLARAYNLHRLQRGKTYIVGIKESSMRNGVQSTNGETETKAVFRIKRESA